MERDNFRHKLLKLVIPITLQQLMMALVSVSDAVMLGFLSQDDLSASSLAGQVQFVFSLFLFAITAGVSIFAAQYWGINDRDSVEKVLGIGLKLSVLISLPFTLGALICPHLMMRAFASDPVLIEGGAEYLRWVALSYLMLGISQVYLCIMKNCGNAVKSSMISSAAVVVNIVFNWLLIFGVGIFPRMEIAGAALATVISKVFELVWTMIEMCRKGSLKIRFKYVIHSNETLWKDYRKYTLPILGNQIGWGLGFTMYTVIMGHLGSDAAAANSIANIIKNLAICFCTGIAGATGVIIGIELGQGRLDTAKKYGAKICRIAIAAGFASGLIVLAVIPFVHHFTTLSETAQDYLKTMLAVCSYYVVGKSINMTTISGVFPAGGDSKFGFKCDCITMWCITVPIGLIAAFVLKLPVTAVYILINIDEIIKLPTVYKHYKKYLWLKNLTKNNNEQNSAKPKLVEA